MICSSVNRPFFISESPFVASSYCADLKTSILAGLNYREQVTATV
jgi:hypothetical protein